MAATAAFWAFKLTTAPQVASYAADERLLGQPVDDPDVVSWVAIARAYWGGAVPSDGTETCSGGVVLRVAETSVQTSDPEHGGEVLASAELGGCVIALDPDHYPMPADAAATPGGRTEWRSQMCTVIAHEYGHLLGKEHVNDARNIMYPYQEFVIQPCVASAAAIAAADYASTAP